MSIENYQNSLENSQNSLGERPAQSHVQNLIESAAQQPESSEDDGSFEPPQNPYGRQLSTGNAKLGEHSTLGNADETTQFLTGKFRGTDPLF